MSSQKTKKPLKKVRSYSQKNQVSVYENKQQLNGGGQATGNNVFESNGSFDAHSLNPQRIGKSPLMRENEQEVSEEFNIFQGYRHRDSARMSQSSYLSSPHKHQGHEHGPEQHDQGLMARSKRILESGKRFIQGVKNKDKKDGGHKCNKKHEEDLELLGKLSKFLEDDLGNTHDLIESQGKSDHKHYSHNLEFVTVGTEKQNQRQLIFFIKGKKELCCYSLSPIEQKPKYSYKFKNKIYSFKLFDQGNVILVSGKAQNDQPALQAIVWNETNEKYQIKKELTSEIKLNGDVIDMKVYERNKKIFLVDSMKKNQKDGDSQERLVELVYELGSEWSDKGITLTFKKDFISKCKISYFQYDEHQHNQSELQLDNCVYVTDYDGNIIRLNCERPFSEKSNQEQMILEDLKTDERATMGGIIDIDEDFLYVSQHGSNVVRRIDKVTKDQQQYEVGSANQSIKICGDYLILTNFYSFEVVEMNTFQILAKYRTEGEVTAFCYRDKDPDGNDLNELIGFTTYGQLFRISLGIREEELLMKYGFKNAERNIKQFCKNDRIMYLCTLNKNVFKNHRNHQTKIIAKQDQPMFMYDDSGNIYKVDYGQKVFTSRLIKLKDKKSIEQSRHIHMKNFGDTCLVIGIGTKVYLCNCIPDSNDQQTEIEGSLKDLTSIDQREYTEKEDHQTNYITSLAGQDILEFNFDDNLSMASFVARVFKNENSRRSSFHISRNKQCVVFTTKKHQLKSIDLYGRQLGEISFYDRNLEIIAMDIIQIGFKQYVLVATNKSSRQESVEVKIKNVDSEDGQSDDQNSQVANTDKKGYLKDVRLRDSILYLTRFPYLKDRDDEQDQNNDQNQDQAKDDVLKVFAIAPKRITCLRVSIDQNFIAAGCIDGQIIIYRGGVGSDKKIQNTYEKLNSHGNKVTDIVFIKGGHIKTVDEDNQEDGSESDDSEDDWDQTDYLIASVSLDQRVVIMSLRQRLPVFVVNLRNFLTQICFHRPTNKLFIRSHDLKTYQLDMNFKLLDGDPYKDGLTLDKRRAGENMLRRLTTLNQKKQMKAIRQSQFTLEILRQFVHSEDVDQLQACIPYINETSLIFRKINCATLAAYFGRRVALDVALKNGVEILNTLDGTTLMDLNTNSNVFNKIIYQQILQKEDHFFMSQDDHFFEDMLKQDYTEVRKILSELFTNSRFIDGGSNMRKGQIKKLAMFETDQRLISDWDLSHAIITRQDGKESFSKNDNEQEDLLIIKTLRVPLYVQIGHPMFLKFLNDLILMKSHNNREQRPIELLIKYFWNRDKKFIKIMQVPHFLMSTLTLWYLLNSYHEAIYEFPGFFEFLLISSTFFIIFLELIDIYALYKNHNYKMVLEELPSSFNDFFISFMILFIVFGKRENKSINEYMLDFTMKKTFTGRNDGKMDVNIPFGLIGIVILILGSLAKLIYLFQFNKESRTIRQYMQYVTIGLIPFFAFFFMMVFGFAMIDFILQPGIPRAYQMLGKTQSEMNLGNYQMFTNNIIRQYQLIFGENPDIENQALIGPGLAYFAFTLFCNVVYLNLLISIIGIIIDDMQMKQKSLDVQTQIGLMLPFNRFMFVMRSFFAKDCFKRSRFRRFGYRANPNFVHYLSKKIQDEDDLMNEDGEFEGKIKMLTRRQDGIMSEAKNILRTLEEIKGTIAMQARQSREDRVLLTKLYKKWK